jgi:hypothetical protein
MDSPFVGKEPVVKLVLHLIQVSLLELLVFCITFGEFPGP